MYKSSKQDFQYKNIGYADDVIITISWHIENPDIVRIVYSAILRHIHGHSARFSHVPVY